MKTTTENVRPEQIEAIRREAAAEGSESTVRECDRALAFLRGGRTADDLRLREALRRVVEYIRGAEIREEAEEAPAPWHTGEDGAAIFDAGGHRILDVGRSRAHLTKRIVEAVNAFSAQPVASSGGSTAPAEPKADPFAELTHENVVDALRRSNLPVTYPGDIKR